MAEPKTYQIDTIADLLKVPADRREQCAKELLIALAVVELAGVDFQGPLGWTDDGDMSCSLDDPDGNELLSLEVTHG